MPIRDRFWETTALDQMSVSQWESLCDGCGLCCQVKLQDEDDPEGDHDAEVFLTDVACRLLDCTSCRCSDYLNRKTLVPECLVLTPDNLAGYANWLPDSCAYKRLHFAQPLPDWHPLVSGDPLGAQRDGPGMAGKLVSEARVPDHRLEDHIVDWPK